MPAAETDLTSLPAEKAGGAGLRLLLLGYLLSVALGCISLLFGVCFGRADFAVAGGLGAGSACLLRLRLRDRMQAGIGSGEADISVLSDDKRMDQLIGQLREWEELERARGMARFDPWALQSVRREIQMTIEESPHLDRLLRP